MHTIKLKALSNDALMVLSVTLRETCSDSLDDWGFWNRVKRAVSNEESPVPLLTLVLEGYRACTLLKLQLNFVMI